MPELFTAIVSASIPIAEGQTLLALDVPTEVWSAHIRPAQYLQVVLPDIPPWHGTIANHPGNKFLELLVKDRGERSHRVSSLKPGDELEISKPRGNGFPLYEHRGYNLILMAGGIAISAMRPVIQDIIHARPDWGNVLFFYGERTADSFAFTEERERWREGRIDIYLSASRPAEGTRWKGHVGYVQDLLLDVNPEVKNTVAYLAGHDNMIESNSDVLMRIGMPQNMIFVNR